LVLRYESGSPDSAGRYRRINGSGRVPGRGDPTLPVSDSLVCWGWGTDSRTSSGGGRSLGQPLGRKPGVAGSRANWEWLGVLEAQRAEMRPDLEAGLGALWRGSQPRPLQLIAARTETETVWPGELTEEQTEISLL